MTKTIYLHDRYFVSNQILLIIVLKLLKFLGFFFVDFCSKFLVFPGFLIFIKLQVFPCSRSFGNLDFIIKYKVLKNIFFVNLVCLDLKF